MVFQGSNKPTKLIIAFATNAELFLTKIEADQDPPTLFSTTLSAASAGCSEISILAYSDQSDSNNKGYLLASLTCSTGAKLRLFETKGSEDINFEHEIEGTLSTSAFTSFDAVNLYSIDRLATKLAFIKNTESWHTTNNYHVY